MRVIISENKFDTDAPIRCRSIDSKVLLPQPRLSTVVTQQAHDVVATSGIDVVMTSKYWSI